MQSRETDEYLREFSQRVFFRYLVYIYNIFHIYSLWIRYENLIRVCENYEKGGAKRMININLGIRLGKMTKKQVETFLNGINIHENAK